MTNLMTDLYDSNTGADFDGSKTLGSIGFTDVQGGVASFAGGNLVLTPDNINGGTDAYKRDFVVRTGAGEQKRDMGATITLPPNYRTGNATIGAELRFGSGSMYLFNFAPDNPDTNKLAIFKNVSGTVSPLANTGTLVNGGYDTSHPVDFEPQVLLNPSRLAITIRDLTTTEVIGFLEAPLDSEAALKAASGSFGLCTWMTGGGTGSIKVARVQSYVVIPVAVDGDSIQAVAVNAVGYDSGTGTGTAKPTDTTKAGKLQRKMGNRYRVLNRGRSGYTIPEMAADAAARIDAVVASAEQQPVDVIGGGTNDIGNDGVNSPSTMGLSTSAAASAVYARLAGYVAARKAAMPTPRVLVETITPADHPAYATNLGGSHAAFNLRRDAYNALLLAGVSGAEVLDKTRDLRIGPSGSEQNSTYFNPDDKTHETDAARDLDILYIAHALDSSIALPDQLILGTITGVSVTPATKTVYPGAGFALSATVAGTGDFNPAKSLGKVVSGDPITLRTVSDGSVDVLVAENATPGTYQVRATSVQDDTKSATATITVQAIPTGGGGGSRPTWQLGQVEFRFELQESCRRLDVDGDEPVLIRVTPGLMDGAVLPVTDFDPEIALTGSGAEENEWFAATWAPGARAALPVTGPAANAVPRGKYTVHIRIKSADGTVLRSERLTIIDIS